MNIIVLISGKMGSGKSTLAQDLAAIFTPKGYGYLRLRFAEGLYRLHDACLPILKELGIIPESTDKEGDLLQIIGTEYGRNKKGENVWVDIVRKQVDRASWLENPALITIEDARFPNEFDAFPDAFRVRLEAPAEVRKARCHSWRENQNHPSEVGLDAYAAAGKFDLVIDTSIVDRQQAAKQVADCILN